MVGRLDGRPKWGGFLSSKFVICLLLALGVTARPVSATELSLSGSIGAKEINILVTPPAGATTCSCAMHAGFSKPLLNGAALVTRDDTSAFEYRILEMKRVRDAQKSKRMLFCKARCTCDGVVSDSAVKKILISSSPKKDASLPSRWIKELQLRLQNQYELVSAFPNISFSRPLDLQKAPSLTNRLFVVEQNGKIYSFVETASVATKELFLDISNKVATGGERGLLGLVFHPNYATNRTFFLHYINMAGASVLARMRSTIGDLTVGDSASEEILLTIPKASSIHHGGQLAFGEDGLLYVSVGDGGPQKDPLNNGQRIDVLLGKMLRIDVDTTSGDLPYGIPASNPFVGKTDGSRAEIFALGFRNPWRFSFDSATGELIAGDVGNLDREEIDIVEKGKNYGWNKVEGSFCHVKKKSCKAPIFTAPLYEYPHTLGNSSVTGGHVYYGAALPHLFGKYTFADFSSGRIWALSRAATPALVAPLVHSDLLVSGFGISHADELLMLDYGTGHIFQFAQRF